VTAGPGTRYFCPLCHGEITYAIEWTEESLRVNYTESHAKDCENVPSERDLRVRAGVLQVQPGIPGHCPEPLETLRDQRLDIERDP